MNDSVFRISICVVLTFMLVGCLKVEYNYKGLGFADKTEMESAFAKGYHTKEKLLEFHSKADKPAPSAALVAQAPQVQQEQSPAPAPTKSKDVPSAATCTDTRACVDAMLAAAKVENLTAAMDAARRIDGFEKPQRGDRKQARKLNDDGLAAFKQSRYFDAISSLTKANELDKSDEEIISNLAYIYFESGNSSKAILIAADGFLLNPRRASLWMPYAQANAKSGNQSLGLQAMWLAWQFSSNKEMMLTFLEKKITEEQDEVMKIFYVASKAWLVDNKKQNF